MDFMKVLDQTVREIKREVNIKVLKVPEIEQKVLDATSNEPWGPHGSVLAEIAQSTKKFSECQLIMSALWARLGDGGRNWRHVYKALSVIEYLIAHGSERALDDTIEHTFQISSLTGFEYMEPNGKDVGINVRKKAETIMGLLSDKNKITEARNKAAANRDKYFGLSSTGITYKSTSATTSLGSGGFQSGDRYGGTVKREGEMFKESYRDKDNNGEDEFRKDSCPKSRRAVGAESERNAEQNGSTRYGRDQDTSSPSASKTPSKLTQSGDNYGTVPAQSSDALDGPDNEFDDFDPRGTSKTATAVPSFNQVDLLGDFMDAPPATAPDISSAGFSSPGFSSAPEVDLFADAAFVSASPSVGAEESYHAQANVDLFASQPTFPSSSPKTDFFSDTNPASQTETTPRKTEELSSGTVDPFAAVPLNSFDGADAFGAFTSNTDQVSTEPDQNSPMENSQNNSSLKPLTESKPSFKKDPFQVKSGIWADSLSRGIIDLNISAPKKVNLSDIGIVGGLNDGSEENAKGPPPVYMGRAMSIGTGMNRSGISSTGAALDDDFFSSLSQQQQFGNYQK